MKKAFKPESKISNFPNLITAQNLELAYSNSHCGPPLVQNVQIHGRGRGTRTIHLAHRGPQHIRVGAPSNK